MPDSLSFAHSAERNALRRELRARRRALPAAARIAGARLALIPDMGHDLVPVGHPEIVRRVLGVLLPFLPSAATPSA